MPPLLLGHRGARAHRGIPENTLLSFERCLDDGCDGFEFDVRLSADGYAVICHDAIIRGSAVARSSSQKLALPELQDVLRQFAQRAFLDIELKVAGVESLTLEALRQHPPQKGYVVSSFLSGVLAAMHALDASVPLGLLAETAGELHGWPQAPAEWVIPHWKLTDKKLVDSIHAAGKKIMLWTVNSPERMRQLSGWGVDAIVSDETELLVRTLR